MSAPHSLLWRLVPWLFPPLLILIGLIFVASSLTGNDEPDDIVAPPNVRELVTANAAPWAQRQVEVGITSTVTAVSLVRADATDAASYTVRVVISRVDAPPGLDTRVRTIVTCVRWAVDVRTGTIAEHGATQLSNDSGRLAPGDPGELRRACRAALFAS